MMLGFLFGPFRTQAAMQAEIAALRHQVIVLQRIEIMDSEVDIQSTTGLIWKLLKVAEKQWRTSKGFPLLKDVYAGKQFVDGRLVSKKSDKVKAIAA